MGDDMPTLSSGYVIAGAYADKLRRTMFAQLREEVKKGTISTQEIARAVGELNSTLYRILVERLRIDKGDVVRIRIDYRIENGRIVWDSSTLQIEIFRRDQEAERTIKERGSELWGELYGRGVEYQIIRLGETIDGDVIYTAKLGEEEVGALAVTQLDNELFIKKGAVIHPSPMVFEKLRIPIPEGAGPEEALAKRILEAQKAGKHVSEEEARKIINYLRERVKAEPLETATYEETSEEI